MRTSQFFKQLYADVYSCWMLWYRRVTLQSRGEDIEVRSMVLGSQNSGQQVLTISAARQRLVVFDLCLCVLCVFVD